MLMPTTWDTSHGYPYQPLPGFSAQQETGPYASGVEGAPVPSGDITGATDTVAIAAALAALPTGKGRVFLAPGTYWTTGVFLGTGQYLVGAGVEATVLKLAANTNTSVLQTVNFASLTGTNTTGTPFNFGWSNLTIDGNGTNQSAVLQIPPVLSSITTSGTPGAAVYNYVLTAVDASGNDSAVSYPVSISTGNATLSGSNFNVLTPSVVPANGYNVYRCPVAGGSKIDAMVKVNATPILTATYNDVTPSGSLGTVVTPYGDRTVKPLVSIYGYGWRASNFVIRNGNGTGLWTEWAATSVSPGNDSMEAVLTNFKVHDCNADGWVHIGPHDTQASNFIIYSNGGSHASMKGIRLPSANGAANGTVLSLGHVWGGTYGHAVYCGASGVRLADFIAEGGTLAELWIDASQVQWDGFLYSGSVNTASVVGVQLGSTGNTVGGNNLRGRIENMGGGAVDVTNGGDHNDIDVQHYYYSGTTPTGASLSLIGNLTAKNRCRVNVTNNSFLPDTATLNQVVGRQRFVRTIAGDTNDLLDIRDETGTSMYKVDYKGRPRSPAGSTPAVSVGANIGAGGTVGIAGTDHAGTVTVNVGTGPALGQMAIVTFSSAFGATPRAVIVGPGDTATGSANLGPFASKAASAFSVRLAVAPTASTTYTFDYVVIGS